MKISPEGALQIDEINRKDANSYTCIAENSRGRSSIIHKLIVIGEEYFWIIIEISFLPIISLSTAPPLPPEVTVTATTTDDIVLKLKPNDTDATPITGYTLHYKSEFGEWESIQISNDVKKYVIEGLICGSRYQLYVTGNNRQFDLVKKCSIDE